MDRLTYALAALMAVVLAPASGEAQPKGDPAKGQALYEQCAACHEIVSDANALGPTLKGVLGRKAAGLDGYNYSPAMKRADVVWSAQTLDAFLADPQALIPGTKMPFAGMPQVSDRADLIAYIQQAGSQAGPAGNLGSGR
jgi:cytochrome c